MNHSSTKSSCDGARASGSHVSTLRMNLRNLAFSSLPCEKTVTKSSRDVSGTGAVFVQSPVTFVSVRSKYERDLPTFVVEEYLEPRVFAALENVQRRWAEDADVMRQGDVEDIIAVLAVEGLEDFFAL